MMANKSLLVLKLTFKHLLHELRNLLVVFAFGNTIYYSDMYTRDVLKEPKDLDNA